jgi:hypothetical protein
VADWRGFQPRLEPERYRIGLELPDSAPGGLAITHESAVHFSGRHGDHSWQKRREAEFIDSKGFRQISGNRWQPLVRGSNSMAQTSGSGFRGPEAPPLVARSSPMKGLSSVRRENLSKNL